MRCYSAKLCRNRLDHKIDLPRKIVRMYKEKYGATQCDDKTPDAALSTQGIIVGLERERDKFIF